MASPSSVMLGTLITGPAASPGGSALAVGGVTGVPAAAGLMFFAFAGYARLATLGEEVREPARTIPRAVGIALLTTLLIYVAVNTVLVALAIPVAILINAVNRAIGRGILVVAAAGLRDRFSALRGAHCGARFSAGSSDHRGLEPDLERPPALSRV